MLTLHGLRRCTHSGHAFLPKRTEDVEMTPPLSAYNEFLRPAASGTMAGPASSVTVEREERTGHEQWGELSPLWIRLCTHCTAQRVSLYLRWTRGTKKEEAGPFVRLSPQRRRLCTGERLHDPAETNTHLPLREREERHPYACRKSRFTVLMQSVFV